MSNVRKVLIIDGECAFCNKSASFILRKNKKKDIFFTPSQSECGKSFIQQYQIKFDPEKTLIFMKDGAVYDRSSAVIQVAKYLRGIYPLLIVFWIIPKFIRDSVYNFIAKHRHLIINKENLCNIELMDSFKGRMI